MTAAADEPVGTDQPAEDRIWRDTFNAYHRVAYSIEGAMARADDAVARWREEEECRG